MIIKLCATGHKMAERVGSPVDTLKGTQKKSSGNYGRLYSHVTTIKYAFCIEL